ncbi:PIR protein [Plasmodium ovale]|uniref:PIR protein n=1 Tax=Plasmodium ovale TaxID=36330 RepID=A0A1C3KK40_PLAOA|nr:PIR protein [Plasmodium ovale]
MDKNIVKTAYKLLEKDIDNTRTGSKLYIFYNYFDNFNTYLLKSSTLCNDGKQIDPSILPVCSKVEKNIQDWNDVLEFAKSLHVNENECCSYFIYWLYNELKDSKSNYLGINLVYSKMSNFLEKNCLKIREKEHDVKFVKVYDKDVIKNKKELYEFLEYYKYLRLNLENEDSYKEQYCKYVKYIFDLYNEMDQDYNSKCSGFYGEMTSFKKKFQNGDGELNFLKSKCPKISKNIILQERSEIPCPSEEIPKRKVNTTSVESTVTKTIAAVESDSEKSEKIKLYDEISNKLPSLKIYEEFNNEEDLDLDGSYCKNMEIKDEKAKKICAHITKNLKKIVQLENKEQHNEYCLHFVHWVYEKIKKHYGANSGYIYENSDIIKLYEVQFPINNELSKYSCYYNFNSPIIEMKEKTELLDYFQIFDRINNDTICVNDKCKKNCKYFENINTLYNKHRRSCCTRFHYGGYFDNCLDYFKCENKYNPKTFISKLKCQIEKSNKNTEELDEYTPIDENVILKSLKSLSLLNSPKIKCDGLMCDTFSAIMLFFFSLLGLLLLLFLFYKFTPFETWLNNRVVKRRNSFTIHEDINYFQQNTLGEGNVNSQNRRIKIAYQTA